MLNSCPCTNFKKLKEIAHLAMKLAKKDVGARDLKIARNFQKLIAVLNVIKDVVLVLSLGNVVIYFVLEDVRDLNNQIVW